MSITEGQLINWFSYHAPADTPLVAPGDLSDVQNATGSTLQITVEGLVRAEDAYTHIRLAALVFARAVVALTPSSADQVAAVRKIREAVFTANAAIACGGK